MGGGYITTSHENLLWQLPFVTLPPPPPQSVSREITEMCFYAYSIVDITTIKCYLKQDKYCLYNTDNKILGWNCSLTALGDLV